MEKAAKMISDAREILAGLEPKKSDVKKEGEEIEGNVEPASRAWELLHAAEALQSFANSQKAYLLGEVDPSGRRRAASELAPLLEDPNRQVAAAARLWQALLREADPAASVQILESPMGPLAADGWVYGLFARVLRCRFQAAQGQWSTALVMLVHIEEKLDEWVPEAAQRGDARRFFQHIRLQVLKAWHDALPSEHQTERAWCVRQAQNAIQSYFSVETSLLRLEPAIPIIVPVTVQNPGDEKAAPH
jgi:hypothetical protein